MRHRIQLTYFTAPLKKIGTLFVLQLLLLLGLQASALPFQAASEEGVCAPDRGDSTQCTDSLVDRNGNILFPDSHGKQMSVHSLTDGTAHLTEPPVSPGNRLLNRLSPAEDRGEASGHEGLLHTHQFAVHFFWGKGCPHCEEEKRFLNVVKKKYPGLRILDYEVWYNRRNAALLAEMAKGYKIRASGVPITFIDRDAYIGFSKHTREEIEESFGKCESGRCIDPADVISGSASLDKAPAPSAGNASGVTEDMECTEKSKTVYIPWIGNLDTSEMSLPVITLVIAGLDSFNPCAFFVLFSLLGLLIHARSRFKMFLIGGEFVFFSGFIYFLFMTAWLNVFLIMGEVEIITKIAGAVAVIIAAINIKDFFIFKKGVSLTIPDSAKPKLFDRMRRLMKSNSLPSIVIGTAVLAIAANSYELLCTAGFPMVYTRILTLKHLSDLSYYLYLILYNVVYVIPLSVIVIIFTVTLGRRFLNEQQGRMLKLISGNMMLGLGVVLLLKPALLNSAIVSFLLLLGTFSVSAIIALFTRIMGRSI